MKGSCLILLLEPLRKQTRLSPGAPKLQSAKYVTFLIESLREPTSLSLEAPEINMHGFLNRRLKEIEQSEPGSSSDPNAPRPGLMRILLYSIKDINDLERWSDQAQTDAFRYGCYSGNHLFGNLELASSD